MRKIAITIELFVLTVWLSCCSANQSSRHSSTGASIEATTVTSVPSATIVVTVLDDPMAYFRQTHIEIWATDAAGTVVARSFAAAGAECPLSVLPNASPFTVHVQATGYNEVQRRGITVEANQVISLKIGLSLR